MRINRLEPPRDGESRDQPDGSVPAPARPGFAGRCRRHPFILIGLVAACGFVALGMLAEDDHKQSVRTSAALMRAGAIRDALRAHVEGSDTAPSDVRPFVGEPVYVSEDRNPAPDQPGKVAFRIRAEGFRVALVFDADQGPLADKTLFVEFAVKDKAVSYRCWSTDIKPQHLPKVCR